MTLTNKRTTPTVLPMYTLTNTEEIISIPSIM